MKNPSLRIAYLLAYPGLSALSIVIYLLASFFIYRFGFPLDDAWIHQTYARNLGLNADWAYLPGQPSAGSTSPLWSALLALGYFFRLGPYVWTYFLGWVCLSLVAILGNQIIHQMGAVNGKWGWVAGILLVFEWHLIWAAASGMETILFVCVILVVFALLYANNRRWFILGLIVGLSVYIRPDGLTLLGPIFWVLIFDNLDWGKRVRVGLIFLFGFILLFIPYIFINEVLSGAYWPNTFYAKQAEYSIELLDPLWWRLVEQFQLPLVGVGVVLLPGFIKFLWRSSRQRSWVNLSLGIWAIGYLVIYAIRLPVTYQHGRYAIPMMPIYFLCSVVGTMYWLKLSSHNFFKRVLSKSLVITGGVVLLAFWLLGARAYARDVAVIESEMVDTAHWIAANTEKESVIAAHDIGALGYFSKRKLVDLAGLISPQVIQFIRDETELAEFLDEEQTDYLVTFPGWYPLLVKDVEIIYQSNALFAPQQGGENMRVYRWGSIPNP